MRMECCAAMLVLALVPAHGAGAAPQAGSAEAARFRAMDQDRDGVITRSEWRGSTQSFDVHDWNRDGVLSGEEVRPGARRQQPWPADPGDGAAQDSQLSDWTPSRFRDLDHNQDERITRDEWHFDVELFRRVDIDRNGSISRREFLGLGADDDRDDRFRDLDVNGDGRIARAEWHGGPRVFTGLDRDGDGFLSRVELLGAYEDDGPTDLFTSLDINRDGRVTPNEWHWARAGFDRRDANRDGSLSRDELSASAQGCRPHSGARHTAPDTSAGCWMGARLDAKTGSGTGGISMASASSNRRMPGTRRRRVSGRNTRPVTVRRSRVRMARDLGRGGNTPVLC